MPTNNILLFDQNKGNMLNDSAYNTNQQRLNGVQSGIASSQLQNKFQYQVSLVAYAIASIMYNNGMDANDADAVSAFVSNMSNTLVQKVLDKASTQEAQAGTVDTKWMSPSLVKAAIDFTLSHDLTISGNTTFSGTVSGPTPTLDSHLATKGYVEEYVENNQNIKYTLLATITQSNVKVPINISTDYYAILIKLINVSSERSIGLQLIDDLMIAEGASNSVNANIILNFVCSNADGKMITLGIATNSSINFASVQIGQSEIGVINMTSGTVEIYGLSIEVN